MRKQTERGATLAEYVLLVALIAIVSIAALQSLGRTASDKINLSAQTLEAAQPGGN